jgi:hypothetical protein
VGSQVNARIYSGSILFVWDVLAAVRASLVDFGRTGVRGCLGRRGSRVTPRD